MAQPIDPRTGEPLPTLSEFYDRDRRFPRVPFVLVELTWRAERVLALWRRWAALRVAIMVIVSAGAVWTFWSGIFAQREQATVAAWQIVAASPQVEANIGLNAALELLHRRGKSLANVNLTGAWLEGVDLSGAEMKFAILDGAKLEGAKLVGANLNRANLRGANLRVANLRGANLREADLRDADLFGAKLRGANLVGANLTGAKLIGADLREANLMLANLHGTDLYGASIDRAILRGVRNLTRTQLERAWPTPPPALPPRGMEWPFEKKNGKWVRKE